MIVGSDLQLAHDHIDNTSAHDATGGVVGRTKSQILTTKTINLADNTLTGTTAQFNTALSDADFATTALLEARVPVGAVNMWVTGTAPSGWLLCQGQQVAVADYSALASVLGTTYGALTNGSGGSGTTHFRLPDLRGRAPIGAGTGNQYDGSKADIGDLSARTLGDYVSNAETVTLTAAQSGLPQHSHPNTLSDPGHSHTIDPPNVHSALAANWGSRYGAPEVAYRQDYGQTIFPSVTGVTINNANAGPSAASEAHTNTQPSTVINFIIKF
jgi:microcystin-dependent protein